MIDVTERAKQKLKQILSEKIDDPVAGLRLSANDKGELGLSIDIEASNDQVVEYEGSKVLLVEEEMAASLEGLALDVVDTSEGPALTITQVT